MTFSEILDVLPTYYGVNRDTIENIAEVFKAELVHNESGDYDSSRAGYMVFKQEDGQLIKVDFTDDSYNGGYFGGYRFVKEQTKTVKVYD